jgi:DNA-binding LacI/PurR family transcriptional regulator
MALLFSYGHRRFAFLGEAQKSHLYVSSSQRRLAGYHAALAEAGYSLTESDTRLTAHGVESARAAAKELLSVGDRPTAVFASDDILAAGALRAAHDLGLAVPGDTEYLFYPIANHRGQCHILLNVVEENHLLL